MLTKEILKAMNPNTIITSGTITDNPQGINMTNSGKMLRWVAVRGGIADWTIYTHWAIHHEDYIKAHGDKIYNPKYIRMLVPCNEEAFKAYRY